MQDNIPYHKTKGVLSFLQKSQIPLFENWPAQSPDINPIENLLEYIDRNIQKYKIHNVEYLWNKVRIIWNSIPEEFLNI